MTEMFRAAWVIGRRDFVAVIFSKAFFFFLLGPLFPLGIGIAAGFLGGQVADDIDRPVLAVLLSPQETEALTEARMRLSENLGQRGMPELRPVDGARDPSEIDALLEASGGKDRYVAALSGSLTDPVLTGPAGEIARWHGPTALLIEYARERRSEAAPVALASRAIATSQGSREQGRLATAQAAQVLLFLLTMLLAGMVLSNLVEEKTNKIIEILAAAVPIDAIFLGKLFAMLAMALIGIVVWISVGATVLTVFGPGIPALPAPAIGWPIFLVLAFLYFAMAYLLLGSLFLGIGAMASTVREVQTLSMPVTMAQLLVFFLSTYAVTKLGEPIELFTVVFPFSSPFSMLARAAQLDAVWPHLLALAWQIFWALVIIRIGATLFRRNVLKSGRGGSVKKRGLLALFKSRA